MKAVTIIILILMNGIIYADEYVVNKTHILYQSKTENIRAFIEPGTLLKIVSTPIADRYKRRLRVLTQGGLEGEISEKGFDQLKKFSKPIAYLKRPLAFNKDQFESGDKFFAKAINDDDDGLKYKVSYPSPYLSLSDNTYYVRTKTKIISEQEFDYYFNLVSPINTILKYPIWSRANDSAIEWGCESSRTEESIVDIGAGAKVSARGSFFSFFEAEAYVNNDNKKTITYTKNLADEINKHRITYWKLHDKSNSILYLALEKLSTCDKTMKLEYNYVIHFPKNRNNNPIVINRAWVDGKELKLGGTSPISLNTLDDYRDFKSAFKDFKFTYTHNDYDINTAIFHYLMMITANISREYNG